MKIISFPAIKKINISPLQCYDWICQALAIKKSSLLPAKISLKPDIPGVFYNTMPVIIPSINAAGVKLITRYPERVPCLDSQILLYELNSGKNLAIVDGNWITAMRTGAVAAHSVKLFAKKGFKTLGFIGLGNTARATLLVLLALFPNHSFVINLKTYKNQHELFAARFSQYKNIKFIYCNQYTDVIANSDVVISAVTTFERDICDNAYFKKGILVVPIHTKGFTNCDLFFDKIFADDVNHVKKFKYFDRYKAFAEVGDVISNTKPGRQNDDERILAYNIGIGLHDIYFAKKIFDLVQEQMPICSLDAPSDKFWI